MLSGLKLGAIGVVGGFLAGWWLGTGHIEGQWAKADNEALRAQEALYREAMIDMRTLARRVANGELALADTKAENERREDELREQIRKSNTVRTVVKETLANCPVIECDIPDLDERVRLFNAAITNTAPALRDATSAVDGNGEVPAADDTS